MMWRFAMLVAVVGLAPACKKRPANGVRLTYSIDLDAAVDRQTSELGQRLQATAREHGLSLHVRSSSEQVVTIALDDPARLSDVEAWVARESAEKVACESPGPAVCVKLSPGARAAARKAALELAVETIRRRVDRLAMDTAVMARGEQIDIELRGGTLDQVANAEDLIARTGRLEVLVVDDCATAAPTGCTSDGEHTGSPVMKDLYERAGAEPAAHDAGIRAGVEHRRAETGAQHTDYYLLAGDRAALTRYLTGAPADHRFVLEHVEDPKGPYWRSYYVERTARIGNVDIAGARAKQGSVFVELTARGRHAFAELTKQIVGMKLALVLDGRVMAAPIINEPIKGGFVEITTTSRDRDDLATTLAAGALPAPVRLETKAAFGP